VHGLIEQLRLFDRKERFALLREVLGFHHEFPTLNCDFRDRLTEVIGTKVPESCLLAMDYHLDWIELAIKLVKNPSIKPGCHFPNPNPEKINMSQEDIDLLVAFEEPSSKKTHLVMIEAKAYLPWNNKQLESKVHRLRKLMCEEVSDALQPYFVLMTGVKPSRSRVRCESWPEWMKTEEGNPFRLEYELPIRHKAVRCDENGDDNGGGRYLRLAKAR